MHHQIDVTVPAAATDEVIEELEDHDGVLALTLQRGGSLKPEGDVLSLHVLNRSIDSVLAAVDRAREHGPVTVGTVRVESMVATGAQDAIEDDADESPWEEFERTLRHHGRMSVNYLALMALGGAIAVAGLLSPPVPQALALAASAIIAPAFEPVGARSRDWSSSRRSARPSSPAHSSRWRSYRPRASSVSVSRPATSRSRSVV
jgi:hypothetical protein